MDASNSIKGNEFWLFAPYSMWVFGVRANKGRNYANRNKRYPIDAAAIVGENTPHRHTPAARRIEKEKGSYQLPFATNVNP